MRLKRLQLQGYKTFASKTEFTFDDGITAIVGPNGSGKSNIADAVRWVLGEQSYGALRGKRTTDMIFAGSQTRARAGMAQSILTLDNSDGWLPIDYSEVEIGRRAYRSGENEYLLNGQKVRLRDIHDLLATSGLAERTYTIIGQGLIDQALSLRAEERRALFEEAAGISHYKAKRAETLRRLQETQHNLERINDILSEIKPRLRALERQASRARHYEQVETDLRHLLRIWYGYQWEEAKRKLRRHRQTAAEAESIWSASRSYLLEQQRGLDEQRRSLSQQQIEVREKQAARDALREKVENARRQVAILTERQQLHLHQMGQLEQEIPDLEEQQVTARRELDQSMADLAAVQEKMAWQQAELRQFQSHFQAQQAEIDRCRQQLKELEEQRRTTQNRLAQAEGQLSQLQEQLQERQTAVQDKQELAATETGWQKLTAVVETAQTALEERRQSRVQAQAARRDLIAQLKQMRQAHEEQSQRLNQLNSEVARLQARYDLLDQMRHKEIQVGQGIPLLGRLAGLLTIPAEYRPAIEAALDSHLAALITPDEATLWQLVHHHNGKETVTAVAANRITAPPSPEKPEHTAVIGWASEVVQCQPDSQPLVQLLLGRILLVQDEKAAYALALDLPPGAAAVTPSGFVALSGGLVRTSAKDRQGSLLAQEEAWRQAADALAAQKGQQEQWRTAVDQQQREIRRLQESADKLNDEERRLTRLEQEATQRLANSQRDLDRARQQYDFWQRQQATHSGEIDKLTGRIRQLQSASSDYQEQAVVLETAVAQARAHLQELPIAEAQQQRQNLRQQVESAQTILAGRQAVVDSRRSTLNQVDNQLKRRLQQLHDLKQQQQQIDLEREKISLAGLQAQMDSLAESLSPLQSRLDEGHQQLARSEEEIATRQRQTHDQETRYTQSKINLNQYEIQLEGLRERIRADLGLVALHFDEDQVGQTPLPIAEVVEQLPQVSQLPEDIEESIQRYRGQLHRLGAINPEAPVEYEETQTRHDFLTQQVDDLHRTEQQLRQIISELDVLTSKSFAATVEKVNGVFGEMFTRLFGGGSAQLILTEPDDLTISGVEIVARLPGRRQQGLGLLSGGERSLTAAALIFALLKVSPTPFCILDEVDAMLDEANISRFRDVLIELSAQTQFIVVTHNRGTVQAARTVYGVSMRPDSASEMISIKPDEYINA
jgi:chromosome segregation protein